MCFSLYVVSNGIVKLHHGELSVHSEGEGHGCTFTMTLPTKSDSTGLALAVVAKHDSRPSVRRIVAELQQSFAARRSTCV